MNLSNRAVVFDWDLTLSPHYMQSPLFTEYGIDESLFWAEVNTLCVVKKVPAENFYLDHILTYKAQGRFPGLTNKLLSSLGNRIDVFPGVEELFHHFQAEGIPVYIITGGLSAMLKEKTAGWLPFDHIYGATFDEDITTVINSMPPENKPSIIDSLPEKELVYIGDGLTDVPAFKHVKGKGGTTIGVYRQSPQLRSFHAIESIRKMGVLDLTGLADYRISGSIGYWLVATS